MQVDQVYRFCERVPGFVNALQAAVYCLPKTREELAQEMRRVFVSFQN